MKDLRWHIKDGTTNFREIPRKNDPPSMNNIEIHKIMPIIKLPLKQVHFVGQFGFKKPKKRNAMLPNELGNPSHFEDLIQSPHITNCKNHLTPEVGCRLPLPRATGLSLTSKGTKQFPAWLPYCTIISSISLLNRGNECIFKTFSSRFCLTPLPIPTVLGVPLGATSCLPLSSSTDSSLGLDTLALVRSGGVRHPHLMKNHLKLDTRPLEWKDSTKVRIALILGNFPTKLPRRANPHCSFMVRISFNSSCAFPFTGGTGCARIDHEGADQRLCRRETKEMIVLDSTRVGYERLGQPRAMQVSAYKETNPNWTVRKKQNLSLTFAGIRTDSNPTLDLLDPPIGYTAPFQSTSPESICLYKHTVHQCLPFPRNLSPNCNATVSVIVKFSPSLNPNPHGRLFLNFERKFISSVRSNCTFKNAERNHIDDDETFIGTLNGIVRGRQSWSIALNDPFFSTRLKPRHIERVLLHTLDDSRLALRFFNFLGLHKNFHHSTASFCILVHALVQSNHFWPACSLLQTLLQRGLNPRLVFEELLNSYKRFNFVSSLGFDLLIQSYVQNRKVLDAVLILRLMGECRLMAEFRTLGAVFGGLIRIRRYNIALSLFDEVVGWGVQPDCYMSTAVVKSWCELKDFDKAKENGEMG
nr:putative pentatricopeptide repeat-containing protein At5g59900 isoform X1 [Ipomoea batatas]